MSISSIGSLSSLTTSNLFGVSRPAGAAGDASSDGQQAKGVSRFATAIQDAFASLGISFDASGSASASTTSSSASGSTTDATSTASTDTTDAVGSFLQSLFAALHSQSSASAPTDDPSTSDGDATTRAPAAGHGHGHHHHGGKVEADLQSLISQLTTSSASTTADASSTATGATSATATTAATTTSGDALSTLEKNFDALLGQKGVSAANGNDALATFLQSLASSLHGAPATGNVVSTAA